MLEVKQSETNDTINIVNNSNSNVDIIISWERRVSGITFIMDAFESQIKVYGARKSKGLNTIDILSYGQSQSK